MSEACQVVHWKVPCIWKRHLPSHHIKHFIRLLEERVMVSSDSV